VKKPYRSLVFACLFSGVLHAQSDSIQTLPAAEVTALRVLHYAVGQRQTVLDSASMAAFQLRSLSDLLSQNTALDLRLYGNSLVTLSTRGAGVSHTAFVWNGINLQNTLSGLVDLSTVPVSGMTHAGFKTGGESALFGSGALSGVVFLEHDIAQKSGWHGGWSGLAGQFGNLRQQGRLSGGNSRFAAGLDFSLQRADNDFPFLNTAALGQPIQRQVNAQTRNAHAIQQLFWQISHRTVLKTWLWQHNANRQIPPSMIAANQEATQRDQNTRCLAELTRYTQQGGWHTRAAWTNDLLIYNSLTVTDSRNRGQTRLLETEYDATASAHWRYRIGVQGLQNVAISNNYETTRHRNRVALFGAQTFDLGSTKFSTTLRQEMVDGRLVPLTANLGGQHNLNRRWTLRSALGRHYNLPALNDLYWANLGNPNLQPEYSWSAEAGTDWRSAPDQVWQNTLSLTAYALRIRNRIQWLPGEDGIWRPSNLLESTSLGIEASAETRRRIGKGAYGLRTAYQYTYARTPDNLYLIYVPAHQMQASASAQWRNWSAHWRQTAISGRPMTADNGIRTKAFTVANAEFNWSVPVRGSRLSLMTVVQNVFNTDYQVIQYSPMPMRHVMVQAGVSF
jgi:vitamin B12 transporter